MAKTRPYPQIMNQMVELMEVLEVLMEVLAVEQVAALEEMTLKN